ncbi:subtilisin-like protein [Anaeromyces robustus]|uniref:Subtilisin-like protein n=1 Tax=Anaeromyces robustus TaxID=1754192 RepID=A0A1Y1XCD5_9FUNG|nr:subtilisin-like protein [Anaeromyces robustus]|eukprot:ORX83430.1 subtilisin-like protein [Anaeromyces robustus]
MKFLQIATLLNAFVMSFTYAKSKNEIIYNKKQILSETHWKNMNVDTNAPSHLSVISQGKFDEGLYDKYDKNYYYPSSAGQGVNVYMMDTTMNLTYDELSEVDAHIDFIIENGELKKPENDKVCININSKIPDHGSITSAAVTGKTLGVARKANIHGIIFNDKDLIKGLLAWLKYFKENNLIKSYEHKTIFSFSIRGLTSVDQFETGEDFRMAQELINEISNMGVVFVAGAGNDDIQSYDVNLDAVSYPCSFDNVICVGGVGNFATPGINNDEIDSSYYTIGKFETIVTFNSNYGNHTDIYAPYVFHYRGNLLINDLLKLLLNINENDYEMKETEYGKVIKNFDGLLPGTSFSTPIVSGVVATLMSEFPEMKFTSKTMLEYLTNLGQDYYITGIPEGCPNVFINNGKRIIYSDFDNEIDISNVSNTTVVVSDVSDNIVKEVLTDSDNEIDVDIPDNEVEALVDSDSDDE